MLNHKDQKFNLLKLKNRDKSVFIIRMGVIVLKLFQYIRPKMHRVEFMQKPRSNIVFLWSAIYPLRWNVHNVKFTGNENTFVLSKHKNTIIISDDTIVRTYWYAHDVSCNLLGPYQKSSVSLIYITCD